jgi:hypothetical protein
MAMVAVAAATGNVLEFVLSEITHCVLALVKLERVAPTFD